MGLEKTVERIVPENFKNREEYLLWLRHLFAYEEAISKMDPASRVLEVGFGEGYGAHLMAQTVDSVTALDVAEETVEYAREEYNSENCTFLTFDGKRIPFDDGTFDVVTSFQVIEHVENDRSWTSELARVLKKGGSAFFTTPNRETRLEPGEEPWNEFHEREYRADELKELLQHSFTNVNIQGVRASETIEKIEQARVDRSLSLYKLLPDRVKSLFYGRFKADWGTDDFYLDPVRVESSMDLFVTAYK